MTSARKRKLQQQRVGGAKSVPEALVPEDIPLPDPIFGRYFMAEYLEGETPDEDAWHVFNMLDFCNPALLDGTQSRYAFFSVDSAFMQSMLDRLDALQEKVMPSLTTGERS